MSEDDNTSNTNNWLDWLKANKLAGFGLLLLILFLICLVIWAVSDDDGELTINELDTAQILVGDIPEQAVDAITRTDWVNDNFSLNVGLAYSYPADWTKETSVSDDLDETVNLRSPLDTEGHYYCLDMIEYSAASTVDLSMLGQVYDVDPTFTADGIGKPLNRVTYGPVGSTTFFHHTVIDDTTVETGDNVAFEESITNPEGRRLQIIGQYNCDNPEYLGFTQADHDNGFLYLTAAEVTHSIAY